MMAKKGSWAMGNYKMKCGVMATLMGMAMASASVAYANDSAGYVGTGGISYLKNDDVAMQSEDLYISKDKVLVRYEFKNLTNKDVNETIVFPLPPMGERLYYNGEYADYAGLVESFKVWVNGKEIKPKVHVRALLPMENANGVVEGMGADITEALKQCGFSDKELMLPWTGERLTAGFKDKLNGCDDKQLQDFLEESSDLTIPWFAQIVYSWEQRFKADAVTKVMHEYQPLVGGGVAMNWEEGADKFCFSDTVSESNFRTSPYNALSYILTTGANWAKPIEDFSLTIERDDDEWMSLCWDGKFTKIGDGVFRSERKNFTPTKDLDIVFLHKLGLTH